MSKKDEALKLARQLISNLRTHSWTTSDEQFVLKAIDEALAEQPASNVNATGGPKAFFSLAEQPAPPGWIDELAKVPDNAWPAQQQEPVCDKDPQRCWSVRCQLGKVCKNTSLPASKPWVGLTDGQLNDLYATHHDKFGQPTSAEQNGWGYERAIEAKLREKNAS